ncbi:MAG: HlyD family efflux transporter periplasmic adaptor subunit [Rikenellaceae bacterium]|jgi:HlyD family secretion protein|nr:HlyD family efflux transporter periplasmic adaptor subunit [Rikenellaceae bacterium]
MKRFAIAALAMLAAACSRGNGDFDASGRFEATETVVSAEVAGRIIALDIQEGDELTAGQPVGQIDTVQLALQIDQLRASVRALESSRTDIGRQVAVTEQQIATQRSEQRRFQALVAADAANQKQVDDITNAIALLEKQLSAQRSTMESGNASLADQAAAARARIAQAGDQIVRSRITSPAPGTVLAKYAEAGEMAAAGRPLFKIGDVEHIYLRAYITADQLTQIKLGQTVTVYSDFGEKGRRSYEGKVTWISDRSEFTPKTIQTRDERADLVYAIKVAVENDGYLKIGMYGELKLNTTN